MLGILAVPSLRELRQVALENIQNDFDCRRNIFHIVGSGGRFLRIQPAVILVILCQPDRRAVLCGLHSLINDTLSVLQFVRQIYNAQHLKFKVRLSHGLGRCLIQQPQRFIVKAGIFFQVDVENLVV